MLVNKRYKKKKGAEDEIRSISQSWNICTRTSKCSFYAGRREREDVLSIGLIDGMDADEFAQKFRLMIQPFGEDDEVILLGDLIGGSPLTNAVNELSEAGLLKNTIVFGGMNLGMALTAVMMKDDMETDMLKENLLSEAKNAIKEFEIEESEEEDDI